jgi:hypothetical protein
MDLLEMDSLPPNYRSTSYFIARRNVTCGSCGASTRVVAVGLPINHEVREEDSAWEAVAGNALLFHIGDVPTAAEVHLRRLAPGFCEALVEPPDESNWANHCEHCGVQIDDHELHCEPGDTFVPISEAQGSKIRLTEIAEPFEAYAAGYSLESMFVPFPRRP